MKLIYDQVIILHRNVETGPMFTAEQYKPLDQELIRDILLQSFPVDTITLLEEEE